jgi:asparagine synthetase B (glutamine-hydrolysing)
LSAAAAQPMVIDNGRFVLTYHGEVYNFKELQAKLVVSA